ncbi:hypothetical protein ACHQM5_010394 [Ranunculus cassubicifolius]
MECNRDEATRAKEIAEKKFVAKDIPGAKKFALKAQNLYPGLQGLPQMLATLDVYLSAGNKIMGQPDFYAILGVNPVVDEETIKKQFRKLALKLHPDKNKAIGADGAFKIISEAWSVLSNRMKRAEYDRRRFSQTSQQKVPSTTQPSSNPFHKFTNKPQPSKVGSQKSASHTNISGSTSRQANPNSFWTVCHGCKMQYEYLREYVNYNLICTNCHLPFHALETPPPATNSSTPTKPGTSTTIPPPQKSDHQHTSNKQTDFQWGTFTKTTGHGSASVSTQAERVVRQAYEKVKRGREEAQAASERHEAIGRRNQQKRPASNNLTVGDANTGSSRPSKKRNVNEEGRANFVVNVPERTAFGATGGMHGESGLKREASPFASKPNSPRELTQIHTRDMLAEKGRIEIRKKLNEWNLSAATAKATSNQDKGKEMDTGKQTVPMSTDSVEPKKLVEDKTKPVVISDVNSPNSEAHKVEMMVPDPDYRKKLNEWNVSAAIAKATSDKDKGREMDTGKQTIPKSTDAVESKKLVEGKTKPVTIPKSTVSVESKKLVEGKTKPVTISDVNSPNSEAHKVEMMVPDPDFHDFDKDRSERCFAENQVWAIYDEEDGMPRYYAMIHSVISHSPFKIKISWLDSKSNSEFGPLDWVGSGFSKTCGDFRVDKYVIYNSLNSFSHRVKWAKGARGAVRILPKKGDVWALYRNWSPDWNELTPDDLIYKYDMVEVVDDYNEEQGVFVTPLVKVVGFKTVFHRHLDPREVKCIPREEMFRLSHQVPSYLLTGSDAPKGCCELDPAATPSELLQVIT